MHKEEYTPKNNPAAQEALRDEANKPDPLYDKTDRNFQRQHQGPQQGKNKDATVEKGSSSSAEEKDII